jgi:DNA-binding transcriptional LysR family regulator
MIDLRALNTFLAVCREKSISAAARYLHISQPSVSVAITQLESRLGTVLFERARSGIRLTRTGDALLRRAQAVQSILQDVEAEVALASDGMLGPLRVGGTPGALVSLLPDAVNAMERAPNRFRLHVFERSDLELMELLLKQEIEIAFVTTGLDVPPEGIEEQSLARDPLNLMVGRAQDALPGEMSLREASALRWVLPEADGAFRRQIDALFVTAEVSTPRDVVRCDSLPTTKAIVCGGSYVTILPRRVAHAELSMGLLRAIRILDAEFSRTIGVRTRRGASLSPLAAEFLKALVALHP